MTVMFGFDEGQGIGLGHHRRCEIIGAALRSIGTDVDYLALTANDGGTAGARTCDARVVVVDSYQYRADDRQRFRAGAIVALDDLDRDLDVALVVNPAPGASRAPHRRAGTALVGAKYAVVDPSLRDLSGYRTSRAPETIIVATGAADAAGVGAKIAAQIRAACPDLRVRLVIGAWGARTVPAGVAAVDRPSRLALEMATADLVVTAGGVALLEALCLGRPTIAVALAANQRGNVDGAVGSGAALAGIVGDIVPSVLRLQRDPELRASLSEAATTLIDGRGASRVAEAIAALHSELGAPTGRPSRVDLSIG